MHHSSASRTSPDMFGSLAPTTGDATSFSISSSAKMFASYHGVENYLISLNSRATNVRD